MQPTLMILAAGMASRYGSMKQTEGFGPSGETIMEYSIYDAIRAGFGKVVFIIRKEFAESFKEKFGSKLEGRVEVEYVFQELNSFVNIASYPNREKPWGTGHALLCAKDDIAEPLAVINADDFYGAEAFQAAFHFLNNECNSNNFGIIGYQLDKTLSEHGTVSRGVCEVNDGGYLVAINERTKIYKDGELVIFDDNGSLGEVNPNASVSMNFWCFHPSVFLMGMKSFMSFLEQQGATEKAEFFIPLLAQDFIKISSNQIKVIPTEAQWFGVTYKEDAADVKSKIDNLVGGGKYPKTLWGE